LEKQEEASATMESETEKESKNENGKVYDKMFRREIELSDDESVTVIIDQAVEGDTGVVVWDAAIVLAKYLQASGGVSGRRVLGWITTSLFTNQTSPLDSTLTSLCTSHLSLHLLPFSSPLISPTLRTREWHWRCGPCSCCPRVAPLNPSPLTSHPITSHPEPRL